MGKVTCQQTAVHGREALHHSHTIPIPKRHTNNNPNIRATRIVLGARSLSNLFSTQQTCTAVYMPKNTTCLVVNLYYRQPSVLRMTDKTT
jgi:hypothetical protein